jgi:hypothetical protein
VKNCLDCPPKNVGQTIEIRNRWRGELETIEDLAPPLRGGRGTCRNIVTPKRDRGERDDVEAGQTETSWPKHAANAPQRVSYITRRQ